MTNPRQVWLRSLGSFSTKVRVADVNNARWLREKLRGGGIECTEPTELPSTPFFTFRALHTDQIDHQTLRHVLGQFPDVELMFEPA